MRRHVTLVRPIGAALVAAALLLALASSAFAATRSYQSQITQANGNPLSSPSGVAVDGSDNVWISDPGTSLVSKFDSSGSYLAQNDGTGSWSGSFYIQDLAAGNTASLIYVADSNFDDVWGLNQADATYASVDLTNGLGGGCCFIRIAVDNSGGANDGDIYVGGVATPLPSVVRIDGSDAVSNFSASASYISGNTLTGTPDHSFDDVSDLAMDASGNVYVADGVRKEVDQFDATGTFVRAFTGSFSSVTAVAVDPTNGNVLIGDGTQGVVHEFDSTGNLLGTFDGTGTPGGSFGPNSLAVDSTGKVYVSDGAHPVVDVFGAYTPPATHDLTVSKTGTGSGTVTSSPAGIDCGATCTAPFDEDAVVTLTPTAGSGSEFTGWSGDCTGTGSCQVTMTAAMNVTANFDTIPQHTLTVSTVSSGSVSSSPAGISCGVDCTEDYDEDTVVTLTPTPAANHHFVSWSGDCTGSGACQVTMSAARSVTATFAIDTHAVNVTKAGTGSGTVTSDVGAIDCGATCSDDYDHGTVVTLTATPASGSTFAGWSGACSGTSTCQVTVSAVRNVTATFDAIPEHTLTVSTAGSGSVSSSPAGISCGADCTQAYQEGTTVTLTATAAAGSHFVGWSGACSGTGSCQVTMSAAKSVTATFAADEAPTCATDPSLCPDPTPGVLSLDARIAKVAKGKAAVKLSCAGETACSGKVRLTAKVKVRKGKRTVTKTVTLGKASVAIAAGGSETVRVKLNRTARKLLAKTGRLKARLVGADLDDTIVLKGGKKPKKRK